MSKKEGFKRIARRTVEGTSATVANKSQMRPYEQSHINEFRSTTAGENRHHLTCFQRVRPKAKASPASRRRRSKPMSMMKSNARSETSEPIIAGVVLSTLNRVQAFAPGDHTARSYGSWVSRAGPNQSKLKIHP
jgi:hypothetical protein